MLVLESSSDEQVFILMRVDQCFMIQREEEWQRDFADPSKELSAGSPEEKDTAERRASLDSIRVKHIKRR